jgi:hypothetical protein
MRDMSDRARIEGQEWGDAARGIAQVKHPDTLGIKLIKLGALLWAIVPWAGAWPLQCLQPEWQRLT